jgi:hypothetical protein
LAWDSLSYVTSSRCTAAPSRSRVPAPGSAPAS